MDIQIKFIIEQLELFPSQYRSPHLLPITLASKVQGAANLSLQKYGGGVNAV
jgi:hypothetical protein